MSDAPAFYSRPSLNVESYDSLTGVEVLDGDVAFYLELAAETGGPVLDLGGGTGRIAWPLAEAGHHVTSLDVSEAMLAAARAKAADHSPDVRGGVTFAHAERQPR